MGDWVGVWIGYEAALFSEPLWRFNGLLTGFSLLFFLFFFFFFCFLLAAQLLHLQQGAAPAAGTVWHGWRSFWPGVAYLLI